MVEVRARAGLGLKELAERLGQAPPNVVAWEKGRLAPTRRHLLTIAAALDVPPWRLTKATPETAELGRLARLAWSDHCPGGSLRRRVWAHLAERFVNL